MKRCRICRTKFEPKISSLQVTCSTDCAIQYARRTPENRQSERKRIVAAEKKIVKEKLKTPRQYLEETQREFNRYIRERDFYEGCISCDNPVNYAGQWTAGHFRTTKAASHLRFNEDNVNKQCGQCNYHKSGNLVEYRARLVEKIGLDRVEALENDNRLADWSNDELVRMRHQFVGLRKDLQRDREEAA